MPFPYVQLNAFLLNLFAVILCPIAIASFTDALWLSLATTAVCVRPPLPPLYVIAVSLQRVPISFVCLLDASFVCFLNAFNVRVFSECFRLWQ